MTWGFGGWGYSPWGGSSPSSSSSLVTVNIAAVTMISSTYLRVQLNTQVLTVGTYLNSENYTISLRSDSPLAGDPVRVVNVFAPTGDVLKADYIYLETTPHTNGSFYEIYFTSLQMLDGTIVSGVSNPMPYASRVTKTMNVLSNLPSHFDKRLDSTFNAVVSAFSIQDDIIGGSRSDRFP